VQNLFSILKIPNWGWCSLAGENFSRPYDLIGANNHRRQYQPDNSTIGSKHSLMSNETDETYVRNGDSYSFVSNGSELRSNHSNSSTMSESSYTNVSRFLFIQK
jgi:hypothetical protein